MNLTDESFFDFPLPYIPSLSPTTSLPSIPSLSPTTSISTIQPTIFWRTYNAPTNKTHSEEEIITIEDDNNPKQTPQNTYSTTQPPAETSNKPEPQIMSNTQSNSITTQNITFPDNTNKTTLPTNTIRDKNNNKPKNTTNQDTQNQKFHTDILNKCKSITDITNKYTFITFHQTNPNGTGHILCTHCHTGKGKTGKLTFQLNSKDTYRNLKTKLKTHFISKTHIYKTIINNPPQERLSLQQKQNQKTLHNHRKNSKITTPPDPKTPKTEIVTNRELISEINNPHTHQYPYTQPQTSTNSCPQRQTTQLALPLINYYSTRSTYPTYPPNTPVHPQILHTQQPSGDNNPTKPDIPLTKYQVIDSTTLRFDGQKKGKLPHLLNTLSKLDKIEQERASLDQKRETLTAQWKETYSSINKITNNLNYN